MPTSEPVDLIDRAARALRRLVAAGALSVFVACTPVPAARPRVTKTGHAYLPQPYAGFAGELQRKLAETHAGPPLDGPLVVGVEIVKARPKTTKLHAPLGDVDNHAKGPLDAATKTGRFWRDDVQIEHLFATKRWAEPGEEPGVRLLVHTME